MQSVKNSIFSAKDNGHRFAYAGDTRKLPIKKVISVANLDELSHIEIIINDQRGSFNVEI